MIILGLNAYHGDSSACLIKDGVVIAAAEEERFRRVKHWSGFPSKAVSYCLDEAGIKLHDVGYIAVSRYSCESLQKRAMAELSYRKNAGLIFENYKCLNASVLTEELSNVLPGASFQGQIYFVEHHKAHLASAFLMSPFEQALAVSVDGFGDFVSTSWGIGKGNNIEMDGRIFNPYSLGVFYRALTQYLGFTNYGEEYKVMELSPYGKPRYLDELNRVVRLKEEGLFDLNLEYFSHHTGPVAEEWGDGAPVNTPLYTNALETMLGPARKKGEKIIQKHIDIARSTQGMYEKALFHLLNHLHREYKINTLALAGGCAMNSVANGKITLATPFKEVFIQPAAGDAGGALGAALHVWHKESRAERSHHMEHAYLGPQFSDNQIRMLLDTHQETIKKQQCVIREISDEDQLCENIAQALVDGKVVGWFQGRMEWGCRALGNRSVLGDPRLPNMKEVISAKIKRRELFRPFASSILKECVSDWFEIDVDSPFMMNVLPYRVAKRSEVPAVSHIDGTGCFQAVTKEANPLFHKLIEKFNDLTGVPMLLNTSFYDNEPLVCRPEEALNCFLRSKMDLLVMGSHVVERQILPVAPEIRKLAVKMRNTKVDKKESNL